MAKLSKTQERVFQMLNKTKEQPISIRTASHSVFSSMLKPKELINGTLVGSKDWKIGSQMFVYYADKSGVFVANEGTYTLKGKANKIVVDKEGYIKKI